MMGTAASAFHVFLFKAHFPTVMNTLTPLFLIIHFGFQGGQQDVSRIVPASWFDEP
jgi:hypothetical protein